MQWHAIIQDRIRTTYAGQQHRHNTLEDEKLEKLKNSRKATTTKIHWWKRGNLETKSPKCTNFKIDDQIVEISWYRMTCMELCSAGGFRGPLRSFTMKNKTRWEWNWHRGQRHWVQICFLPKPRAPFSKTASRAPHACTKYIEERKRETDRCWILLGSKLEQNPSRIAPTRCG